VNDNSIANLEFEEWAWDASIERLGLREHPVPKIHHSFDRYEIRFEDIGIRVDVDRRGQISLALGQRWHSQH
jgi:hypothetical protein